MYIFYRSQRISKTTASYTEMPLNITQIHNVLLYYIKGNGGKIKVLGNSINCEQTQEVSIIYIFSTKHLILQALEYN